MSPRSSRSRSPREDRRRNRSRTPLNGTDRYNDASGSAPAHGGKDSQQDRRVYVGNLSYEVKWPQLKDYMRSGMSPPPAHPILCLGLLCFGQIVDMCVLQLVRLFMLRCLCYRMECQRWVWVRDGSSCLSLFFLFFLGICVDRGFLRGFVGMWVCLPFHT